MRRAECATWEWGRHDCLTFACRCVEAATGRDPLSVFARAWTEAEAETVVSLLGGLRECCAALARLAGLTEVPPSDARIGAMVLIDDGGTHLVGVCLGAEAACARRSGVMRLAMRRAIAAWDLR